MILSSAKFVSGRMLSNYGGGFCPMLKMVECADGMMSSNPGSKATVMNSQPGGGRRTLLSNPDNGNISARGFC